MSVGPDVLVVADTRDDFACRLQSRLTSRGRICELLDGPSAARRFTIAVNHSDTQVLPDIPMFVRASAWWHQWGQTNPSADERFLRAEAFSTLWAAAAMSASTVINRPPATGSVSRQTISSIASRMDAPFESMHRELYVSDPALAAARIQPPIWGEDIDFRTNEAAAMQPKVPARMRSIAMDASYATILVLGARAYATTDVPFGQLADLLTGSRQIASRFQVHFATVTWMVCPSGAVPVRLNPEPDAAELGSCLDEILGDLCQDLCP